MNLTQHQKKILKEMKERKPTLTQKASQGDKVARHYFEEMLGIGDYREEDMCDYPREYVMN